MSVARSSFKPSLFRRAALSCIVLLVGGGQTAEPKFAAADQFEFSEPRLKQGKLVYSAKCAACHGPIGEGVKGKHESPLVGDMTPIELAKVIAATMPEDKPGTCIGEEAEAVAAFIHEAFYSESAQVRNRPPRVGVARLTAGQVRQSLADLYASLDGVREVRPTAGVMAFYFNDDRWKNDKKVLERVDPMLDFDFGRESPVEGVDPKEFYIYWEGGLKVDESGRYEIIVESTCSFVMDFGKIGRKFFDNHVQSGDKTVFRRTVHLTAGRDYPIKIDFIQRKRKTEVPPARFSLRWIKPQGIEEVIPSKHLIPGAGPPVFALQTNLPPDDRSYGFDRGIAVSRQWDDAMTAAAIEFADIASDELWARYLDKHKKEKDENRLKLRRFLTDLVAVAFRGALTDELKEKLIHRPLESTQDDAEAVKVVMLAALKSPYFLYTGIDKSSSASQRAANRLSLVMTDSAVGDDRIRSLAAKDRLRNEAEIRSAAEKLLNDYRTQAKLRGMLLDWLGLSGNAEVNKDEKLYPGFDAGLVADLRSSLDALLDNVVASESSDYRRLFTEDRYFTTPRLTAFYGDDWKPADDGGHSKTQAVPERNFGVLTHPYLMSRLAYHHSTSPIHRGVFLIRYMLGRNLKPPNEAFTPLSPELHPNLTTRERVVLQTKDDNCQACHIKINGLGFTLENFDAVGRFRASERDKPIDPLGSYMNRDGELVELNGAKALADYLANSEDAHRAFVNRAFQFFVKQPAAAYGADRLDRLTDRFREQQFNIRKLIVDIAVVAAEQPPQE